MLWQTRNPRQNKFIKKLEPFQNVFVVKNYGMKFSQECANQRHCFEESFIPDLVLKFLQFTRNVLKMAT